jgi:hypothetical protein
MTEHHPLPKHGGANRAMGDARVEYAEMLFQEAQDPAGAPQPVSELTAQVQTSIFLAMYYEMRHGHDLIAAHMKALEEHTSAIADLTHVFTPQELLPAPELTPELPPAREPVD